MSLELHCCSFAGYKSMASYTTKLVFCCDSEGATAIGSEVAGPSLAVSSSSPQHRRVDHTIHAWNIYLC